MKPNHRYTITLDQMISARGIASIRLLLSTEKGDWLVGFNFLPPLPTNFKFVWKTDEGKLTKRVARYYYKEHGIKLPFHLITIIGNIARDHSLDGETYHFEFVDEFDWDDGDFGDDGSCYWGSNAAARDMLRDNDAWAICFFDDDDNGIARAWLHNADDFWVLWNGYGFPHNPTQTIAQILAEFKGQSYKRIQLSNYSTSDGTLYINNGRGYVIGLVDTIDKIHRFDLDYYPYNTDLCYDCDRPLHEDEVYYGPDNQMYCERCFYRFFDTCEHCGETYDRDDITCVDNRYLCTYCLEDRYEQCEDCGEYYRAAHCPHCPLPKPTK